MNIENPLLRVRGLGTVEPLRWDLWITYTLVFHPGEINQEFQDAVHYWEHDPEWYDLLEASDWDTFRPQQTRVPVEWEWRGVPAEVLDTEWGDEEIRGEVVLHSFTAGVTINAFTPIVTISP